MFRNLVQPDNFFDTTPAFLWLQQVFTYRTYRPFFYNFFRTLFDEQIAHFIIIFVFSHLT